MSDIDTAIGARVRELREGRGMSQARLALALAERGFANFYQTSLSRAEAGDRPFRLAEAVALADIFAVTLDYLVGRAAPSEMSVRAAGYRAGLESARAALDGLTGQEGVS